MSLGTGLNRGVVTRATSAGVWVQMPDLYGSSEIGPLDFIGPKIDNDVADRFSTGDRCLVASVGIGDWIVLGRIETGANL